MFWLLIAPLDGQINLPKSDYTHIAVILDRTVSMESIRDDTIGGFNAFFKEQIQQPGKATLTLVQLGEQNSYASCQVKPIKSIPSNNSALQSIVFLHACI